MYSIDKCKPKEGCDAVIFKVFITRLVELRAVARGVTLEPI